MDLVERLVAYKEYTGLSNSQFADRAGIPRPTLSQFLNGRNKRLSDDFTAKLHNAYPELNVMWLLFGEGDMLLDSNIKISEGTKAPVLPFEEPQDTVLEAHEYEDPAPYGMSSNQTNYGTETYYSPLDSNTPRHDNTMPDIAMTTQSTIAASAMNPDSTKRIKTIMVFYSDNSYEIFTPDNTEAERQ